MDPNKPNQVYRPENVSPEDNPSFEFILTTKDPDPVPFSERFRQNRRAVFVLSGILIGIITVIIIVFSVVNARANAIQKDRLTDIASMQTEIIRISGMGKDKLTSVENKERADAINASVRSALDETKELLKARNVEMGEEQLAERFNPAFEKDVESANKFGNYDRAFNKAMDGLILEYQRSLLAAAEAGNKDEKSVLTDNYDDANGMLGLVDNR